MPADIDHVLLTRFNLPSIGVESIIRAQDGWLRDRIQLFEQYCLPSVRAQTNQSFHWIIYFDPDSPQWLKDRIRDPADDGVYVPIFRASVSNVELAADIRRVTGAGGTRLITTNLDNDDGLAVDFIARLQAVGPQPERTAIYLARGLIKSEGGLYLHVDRHNAFCSVQENWDSPSTCWSDWHNLLRQSMPAIELEGEPGWLQVVHGSNVSNRVHGRKVSPAPYAGLFPGLLADLPTPSPMELSQDLLVARPRRFAKEASRALVKKVVMKLFGKSGLDRAKSIWASRGARLKSRSQQVNGRGL